MNWLPPENQNETAIDYYELVLSGSTTNSTIFNVSADVSLPYMFVLPKGDFTRASVTAVDMCGQRSEPAEIKLVNVTTPADVSPGPNICGIEMKQLENKVTGLGSTLGIALFTYSLLLLLLLFLLF